MAHADSRGENPNPQKPLEVAERRSFKRFHDEVRVRFRDLEGVGPSSWGRSRDLSLGGLCLHSERRVRTGSHLALEIQIESETAPVLALARVLRANREEEGFALGLQFLWVSEEDRANLRRLAAHFAAKYGETGA